MGLPVSDGGPQPIWAPACFEPDDLERLAAGQLPACRDCTEAWHAESKARNRCNGVPGYLMRDFPQEDNTVEHARALRAAGVPLPEIARSLGLSVRTVQEYAREAGTEDAMAQLPTISDEVEPEVYEMPPHVAAALAGRNDELPLEVATPACDSCVHEPVCSLRQWVERLASIRGERPTPPAGLTLTLRADVSCEHFLRAKPRPVVPEPVLTSQQRGQANGAAEFRAKRFVSPETREKMRQSALAAAARRRGDREAASA